MFKSAFVSAVVSDTSITVSGPPSTLQLLFSQRKEFQGVRFSPLPLAAAFHASHLSSPDAVALIGSSGVFDRKIVPGGPAIVSPSSGELLVFGSLRELLASIIQEIFQNTIQWPICKAKAIATLSPDVPVTVIAMGPASTQNIVKSVRDWGFSSLEQDPSAKTTSTPAHIDHESIAIVGMSGRFPGSSNLEEFWSVLEKGLALDTDAPAERHAPGFHGCYIDAPGAFDCRMFNMSPREAMQTDPGQRLLLMTAYEALEMAGYSPAMLRRGPLKRVGAFIGQTVDNTEIAGKDADINYVTGNIRAFASGRLNYFFKWDGPSLSIDTACSSSLVAIETACQKLAANDCDMAIAGGSNILAGKSMYTGLQKGSFLSPTGSCKTFDNGADGYCRGDGVGTLVLKRYADAVVDGDNILACIRAAATNHSSQAHSITHPHCETQIELFREVLGKAGMEAADIDYVELHGTGTQAGDATEFESVGSVLGKNRSEPLLIGGLKPNIGHAEASAGVASMIKAVQMFQKQTVPPHIGIKGVINEKLDMRNTSITIPEKGCVFKAGQGRDRKRILINNFSAAGGNTSILLEEAPSVAPVSDLDPRTAFPVVLSAKTEVSLTKNIANLIAYLKSNPETPLSHVSYTTTARKPMHLPIRKSFVAKDSVDLISKLSGDTTPKTTKSKQQPSVAFAFTGQGSFFAGAGLGLYRDCASFREKLEECHKICANLKFPPWLELVTDEQADVAKATATQTNLALVSVEVALAHMWRSWGFTPSVCIGHSLGEYAALCTTGAMSLYDVLFLVGSRAQLMEAKCPQNTHCMLALRCSVTEAKSQLAALRLNNCDITCINGAESTVVGGAIDLLTEAQQGLKSKGIACKLLAVPFAFHSRQMDPVLADFEALGSSVSTKAPKIPLASTVTGSMLTKSTGGLDSTYFCRQTRQTVQFVEAVESAVSAGVVDKSTIWIEIGPGRVLLDMVKGVLASTSAAISPLQLLPSIQQNQDPWLVISKTLGSAYEAGVEIDWLSYHQQYSACLRVANLPTYAFETKNYWLEPKASPGEKATEVVVKKKISDFSTTCLHQVESEIITPGAGASVTFTSDLSDPRLAVLAGGHLVHGKGLVPSSVYAEMAMSSAAYVYKRMNPGSTVKPVLNLSDMHIFKPMIALPDVESQTVMVSCESSSPAGPVAFVLTSQDPATKAWSEHARCSVSFSDGASTLKDWKRNEYLVRDRYEQMTSNKSSDVDRFSRRMVYRLFKTVVTYDEAYHTLHEVFMDGKRNELAAKIQFEDEAKFTGTVSPHWIDCLAQTGGLVLNADPKVDGTVYLSTGWSDVEILSEMSKNITYSAHVRMLEVEKDKFEGDVYMFDDDRLVAVCLGLRFQRMRFATLGALLGVSPSASRPPAGRPSIPRSITAPIKHSAPMMQAAAQPDLMIEVKAIICEEAGLEPGELGEDVGLADVGIDSILTISILGKLRALTDMDLPSSLFTHHPTLRELRSFFPKSSTPAQAQASVTNAQVAAGPVEDPATPAGESESGEDMVAQVLTCIAEQAGLELKDLTDNADFGDLGIDSILTISILLEIRNLTGLDLPSSLFTAHPTVSSLAGFLSQKMGCIATPQSAASSTSSSAVASALGSPAASTPATSRGSSPSPMSRGYTSKSFLLQGRPSPTTSALFLLPDGSGSALSYIDLQSLGGIAVYALDSPFVKCPLEYVDLHFSKVAAVYIAEIKRLQPQGPYLIGGWSMGGIFAFEVAKQLLESGDAIKALVLVDSPCPRTLPPLPAPTLSVLEKAGLFSGLDKSGKGISEATRQHFVACVRCLENFTPQAIPASVAGRLGPVTVVWARDGMLEHVDAATRRAAEEQMSAGEEDAARAARDWLMGKRDYGAAGWDQLVGKDVSCKVVAGNHFSMMKAPFVGAVGEILGEVVNAVL